MLNFIWLGLILAAVLLGGFRGEMRSVVEGVVDGAKTAVTLSLGLIGVMSLWLGMMRLAERAGLVQVLARWLRPVLKKLFPDVPPDHPAMGSMVLNIGANMLGLLNAATPLGLRAMRDLERLNPHPGVATNAMCTFLAINTGSVQLVPITAVAILAAGGSTQPTAIVGTAFLATLCSSAAGLVAVKTLERLRLFSVERLAKRGEMPPDKMKEADAERVAEEGRDAEVTVTGKTEWRRGGGITLTVFFACFILFLVRSLMVGEQNGDEQTIVRLVNSISTLAIPFLVSFFPLYAALKGVSVYEEFVEGAKEGFQVAVRIIPFLVAMLVAISAFREGGGVQLLSEWFGPALEAVGFPVELLPMALMRPLSGSGSLGIFSEMVDAHGADHLLVRMAGTLYGSTETTFYVIAVYFGAVGVYRTRHAIPAGLVADLAGIIAAVAVCRMAFGGG